MPGNISKINSFLYIHGKQHEEAGVGAEVNRVVATAESSAVGGSRARAEMQHQWRMLSGDGDQEILCRGEIWPGQERGCAPAG